MFIPSPEIRKALGKVGRIFSEAEIAAMIVKGSPPLEKRLAYLSKYSERVKDDDLRKKIDGYLAYHDRMISSILEHTEDGRNDHYVHVSFITRDGVVENKLVSPSLLIKVNAEGLEKQYRQGYFVRVISDTYKSGYDLQWMMMSRDGCMK